MYVQYPRLKRRARLLFGDCYLKAESFSQRRRGQFEPTSSVTIRMPTAMVEALKDEAKRQGVRGYQTLMKQWLEERLRNERLVSIDRVAALLRQLPLSDRDLRRMPAESEHGRR